MKMNDEELGKYEEAINLWSTTHPVPHKEIALDLVAALKAKNGYIDDLETQTKGLRGVVNEKNLQLDEAKKAAEKTADGAIRFIDSSLCAEHQGRVKMQSPGEFIAEHTGKCVLCAYRLNDDLLKRMDFIAGAADEFCNALEAADGKNPETAKAVAYWRQRFGQYKTDRQAMEKRIQPSQNEPSGRCEGPPDYSDTGNENASQR
jgi:hypothetical protein